MTAVIVALVGVALLVVLALGVAWQERRRLPERVIVYGVEESIEYVRGRLAGETRAKLKPGDIRRLLEWSVRYLQDPTVRAERDAPPVAGSTAAARYVQDRSYEAGYSYEGDVILEVLRLQNDYLASLGAIGEAVEGSGNEAAPAG